MDLPDLPDLSGIDFSNTTTIIIFVVLGLVVLRFIKKLFKLVFLVALGFALYYLLT